ncbi:MAG: LuxR C-terminal-related transcriptional regulator [Paramuribaculum sp.]|nr:LuxR C-terminal-related transcriptional regulator [Paramuribaculum sp.]
MKQKAYVAENTMRELIRDNNMLLMAISRFDIAFGFGEGTVAEVCGANGIDVDTFLAVCNLLSDKDYVGLEISLPTLMDYLKRAHTTFLDCTLPKIRYNLLSAINYSDSNEVTFQLIKFFDDYVEEVKRHMDYENNVIFSYVEHLLSGQIDDGFNIMHFSVNHGHMATKLKDLKDVFVYHYKQKDNARLSAVLFDIIVCEKDFMSHFEVERQLLVPEIERLESKLRNGYVDVLESEEADEVGEDTQLSLLSNRERDIIRCVAKGMSNKEIADVLCLSVHTVATHRRNLASKLGIHSTAGIIIFALLHHLVELEDVSKSQG